jgi:hypothetical protein
VVLTLLQSFFATPFFQWDANNGAGIVSHRFWIYWVVTIPLTLLVLGIWGVWVSVIVINYDVEDIVIGRLSIDEEKGSGDEEHSQKWKEKGSGNEEHSQKWKKKPSMLQVCLAYLMARNKAPTKQIALDIVAKKFPKKVN